MLEQRFEAALAGLLHDIGKVEQRAQDQPWLVAPGIEAEGQPVHATWSTYFIQHYVTDRYKSAAYPGAYHHSPEKSPAADQSLSWIVALADKLSAGERADRPDQKEEPPQQMVSIFDRVGPDNQGAQTIADSHLLPLHKLELNEKALFPTGLLAPKRRRQAYRELRDELRRTAQMDITDPQAYLENLLTTFQKTTWCVPSAYYYSVADVSLYDHSRMTAALAVCLQELEQEQILSLLQAVQADFAQRSSTAQRKILHQPVALLVGGDISGVQEFIYTISSKAAAQSLRGRSFYLQLLTEAVLRYVLAQLDLPYSNVIYSGGGHFYLIAPLRAAKQLPAVQQAITQTILTHHGTELYLALGWSEVPAAGFRAGRFPDHWGQMHAALARSKQRRYLELGDTLYEQIFSPPEQGGNPEATCSVCGRDDRPVTAWAEEQEEQARICSLCRSFSEDLGKPLPSTNFLALRFSQPQPTTPGSAGEVLKAFGLETHFLPDAAETIPQLQGERLTIWALNDPVDDRWPASEQGSTVQARRYTVNRVPPLTFDHLQEKVAGGFKRLGVLRLDVDDLGEIFKSGLGELATLSRLATLSFQMSLYFEGWVKHLCENDPYLNRVYSVYAGGDDLFLIGPWDLMPTLARRITDDFARYTAHNPALHVSAGLAFIGGKYPIYQAAEDAADALSQAKALPGKNAFAFLGQAWPWPTFAEVTAKKERIQRLVTGQEQDDERMAGPQAIVHILRQLASDEADKSEKMGERPLWGPWMWQGAYQLTRMAERLARNNAPAEQAILAIRDELNEDDYREISQWGLAARWTQLEIRKRFKSEE